MKFSNRHSLREKCPNTEFFWSLFSRIRIEYGDFQRAVPTKFVGFRYCDSGDVFSLSGVLARPPDQMVM